MSVNKTVKRLYKNILLKNFNKLTEKIHKFYWFIKWKQLERRAKLQGLKTNKYGYSKNIPHCKHATIDIVNLFDMNSKSNRKIVKCLGYDYTGIMQGNDFNKCLSCKLFTYGNKSSYCINHELRLSEKTIVSGEMTYATTETVCKLNHEYGCHCNKCSDFSDYRLQINKQENNQNE